MIDLPELVMMVGLPASGKSTYAEKLDDKRYRIHSSDSIREEFGFENTKQDNIKCFDILHKRIKTDIENGESVIYDATNLSSKRRRSFLNSINQKIKVELKKIVVVMNTTLDDCFERNRKRDKSVPDEVIVRMVKNFQFPLKNEGWDVIKVVGNNEEESSKRNKAWKNIWKFLMHLAEIPQDNPHHTLTIGTHCLIAASIYKELHSERTMSDSIYRALLLRDIGKEFCKEFDDNGIAHYYGHENVSAYLAMNLFQFNFEAITESMFISSDFYENCCEIKLLNLINYHMIGFQIENSANQMKSRRKFERFLGKDLVNDIEEMHYYDILAR